MSDTSLSVASPAVAATAPHSPPPSPPPPAPKVPDARTAPGWWRFGLLGALVAVLISLVLAWSSWQRLNSVEQELARRQHDSQNLSSEARILAKQAQDSARDSAAKVSLLEARLAEVALQRTQLEELIQSLSRSRDENLVVDIDAALRVAQQQASITGSAEPLVAALKQADERLTRYKQPRLDGVRRAIARDIDRVKAVGVADISALNIKLDEAVRLIDELPLLSQPSTRKEPVAKQPRAAAVEADKGKVAGWWSVLRDGWDRTTTAVWDEARSLVRVTRIDHPDAALMAPEQAYFVRENLKLRLLNARLAILSRQFDNAQTDLQAAKAMLERYFDRGSRRTGVALELVQQVSGAARQVSLPRPDDSFAALSAAAAGR